MSKDRMQRFQAQAEEKEKKYDWLGAVESHKKALTQVLKQKSFLEAGGVQERIGYCFYRAAFQAESREEFKQRMQRGIETYEKAHAVYEKLADEQEAARMFRCDAMTTYIGYWLASEAPEKKRLINECWRLSKEALKCFEKANDALEFGKTFNQLSSSIVFGFCLEWDYQAREKLMAEAVKHGEQSIRFLSAFEDSCELARAYATTAFCLGVFDYHFLDIDEKGRNRQNVQDYWQKAKELSEDMTMLPLLYPIFGFQLLLWEEAGDEILTHIKKALEYGRKTRDKFIIGCALDWLAYHTAWRGQVIEDPEEFSRLRETVLQYTEDAKQQYAPISLISPRGDNAWVEAVYTEHYYQLALWETDLRKKRDLFEKARETAPDVSKRAEASGYPEVTVYANHKFSEILVGLSLLEANPQEKKRLLEEALERRKVPNRIAEQLEPFQFWNRGAMQVLLAEIKYELADLDKDPENKKNMFQEAILDIENALRLCSSSSFARESLAYRARFGGLQLQAGTWLNRLYKLTNNKEHLRKAAKALAEAAESFQKVDLKSRIAECHWKAAQTYDAYEEHLKAADSFSLASNSYKSAAESIPQLEDFYQDHARYMEAWSEIERAKYHHKRQEYGKAKESYEKSANLHESTERWSYIAPNYLAWARLEEAEGLSRTEKPEEAKDLFQQAVELFLEAKKSIQAKLETIEAGEEKQVAAELAEASDTRREYCLGRIAVEEAKILDRHGDHAASSRKYGAAAETFQEIIDSMDELGRRELKPIVCLSRAWQMMTQAEAEASPSLYLEASRFFDEAKEHSLDERAKILSLGHSCFCKALEAGTRFEASRDAKLFSTAKRHIEAATNYYLKTGFKTASDYAKATYRLLDAYIYTGKAQTEMNPGKKAQFYQMAERLLEASAGSYMKAKHSEKSEDVRRLLESVKEERQIIMSLNEVLHAPTISSSATSFASPTPTHEQAVGLERFEHAFVEANLMVSEKVTAGEKVEVGLDLVNVARNSGLLVRVDNLVPSGFKVTTLPSQYNMENGTVDLRGRRLEPLKVESFKLALRATRVGVFSLAPRVTYVDDLGKFKTCEPKPVSVTVHPRLAFEFKTKAAQKVFDYLTKSFVEDYMRRRLALEKSGWRTLMQIIKHGKVSKSSVYGAGGHRGPAVSELERRGLAEARVFPGERGRGGRILKMRIAYERETIKRHLDQKVMKIKEK